MLSSEEVLGFVGQDQSRVPVERDLSHKAFLLEHFDSAGCDPTVTNEPDSTQTSLVPKPGNRSRAFSEAFVIDVASALMVPIRVCHLVIWEAAEVTSRWWPFHAASPDASRIGKEPGEEHAVLQSDLTQLARRSRQSSRGSNERLPDV